MSILSASIVDIEERTDESGRTFLAYTIESVRSKVHRRQRAVYTTRRRYADFVMLHARLRADGAAREFPVPKQGLERALNLPLSPQKTRDRANGLQQYLHEVVGAPPAERAQLSVLHAFLGIGMSEADPSVIIVGGGLAGLSAAHHLERLGIDDILLLEAGDRLGGRLHSLPFAGCTVEAGAQWVRGCAGNPLFERVAALGLHGTVEVDAPIAVRAQNSLDSDLAGRVAERLAALDGALGRARRLAARVAGGAEGAGEDGVSAGAPKGAVRANGRSANGGGGGAGGDEGEGEGAGAQGALGALGDMSVRCALRWCGWQPADELDAALEHWRWDYEYSEPPELLSLRHSCAEECTEADFGASSFGVADPRGFSAIAHELAASVFAQPAADGNGGADDGVPEPERAWDGRLRLNTKVTRIERGAHGGVLVTTDDGQQRGAALVLLAVSAGVLQSEQICFAPELPLAKLAALHEVRMGGATKVFLAFPSKFWPEEQAHILIAHPRRGYYAVVSHLGAGAGAGRYPPAGAHILCVTVTGAEARRVDALSDDEVVDEIGELFALVWGEAPVPPPLEARVCRWGSDPLFMGAYAVVPPHGLRCGRGALLEPVGPVHFAGDAFHARYAGSAHGAYLSGKEAASAIAAALASAPPERTATSLFQSLDGGRCASQLVALERGPSVASSPSVRSDAANNSPASSTTPRSGRLSLSGLSLLGGLASRFSAATPTAAPAPTPIKGA